MKRLFIMFLCLLMLYASCICIAVSANDSITVKVGVYENQPKIFTDDKGNVSGFWPDILKYIATEEGWKIEYVHGSWTECLEMLEKNEIDIMPDVAYSEVRDKTYDFSNETVYASWSRVYVQKGSDIQSIPDLEGKTIAVLKGSINFVGPDGIENLVRAFNINCTFIEVDSYLKVFELVENKEADAGVASKDFANLHEDDFDVVKTAIIFQPALLYFAFPQESSLEPYLIERIDYHVKQLRADGYSIYYQSLEKWFGEKPVEKPMIPGWVKWLMISVGGLVLLLAGGSLILRYQVKRKTKELAEDIIERKRAEAAVNFSEIRYRRLFETARDGILILDGESGEIEDVNPFLIETLGYTREELLGKNLWEIGAFKDIKQAKSSFEVLHLKNYIRYEDLPLQAKDGRLIDVEFVSNVYDVEHKKVIQCNIRNITERKKAQFKAQEIRERLTQQLQVKVSEMEAFSYGIAHDLRSPLVSIEGFSRLLREDLNNRRAENVEEDIHLLESGVRKMQDFLDSTLEYSRAGYKIKLSKNVSFGKIAREVITEFTEQFNSVEATVSLADKFPRINADRMRIKQVLTNLVQNSIKYRDSAVPLRIEIGSRLSEDEIVYFVSDNGSGIDASEAEKVFGLFYRGTANGEGSGIGLVIAKKIIEAHGGRIWVQPGQSPQGTTMCFTLPKQNGNGKEEINGKN